MLNWWQAYCVQVQCRLGRCCGHSIFSPPPYFAVQTWDPLCAWFQINFWLLCTQTPFPVVLFLGNLHIRLHRLPLRSCDKYYESPNFYKGSNGIWISGQHTVLLQWFNFAVWKQPEITHKWTACLNKNLTTVKAILSIKKRTSPCPYFFGSGST